MIYGVPEPVVKSTILLALAGDGAWPHMLFCEDHHHHVWCITALHTLSSTAHTGHTTFCSSNPGTPAMYETRHACIKQSRITSNGKKPKPRQWYAGDACAAVYTVWLYTHSTKLQTRSSSTLYVALATTYSTFLWLWRQHLHIVYRSCTLTEVLHGHRGLAWSQEELRQEQELLQTLAFLEPAEAERQRCVVVCFIVCVCGMCGNVWVIQLYVLGLVQCTSTHSVSHAFSPHTSQAATECVVYVHETTRHGCCSCSG